MRRIPKDTQAMLSFFRSHLEDWSALASQLGLTQRQVEDLKLAYEAAVADRAAQQMAQQAARNATVRANQSLSVLRRLGAGCIRSIAVTAEDSPSPDRVYAKASVEPPTRRQAPYEPVKPQITGVLLRSGGSVEVTFSGKNTGKRGFWTLYRQLPGETGWTMIASTTTRHATDVTLPSGVTHALYAVRAQNSAGVSDFSNAAQLRLGTTNPDSCASLYANIVGLQTNAAA